MEPREIRRNQARAFGRRVLHHIRRIAGYGSTTHTLRLTITTIDGCQSLGHIDLDLATAQTLIDCAKEQADTWDRETGVIGEIREDEWSEQVFARRHRELAADITDLFDELDLRAISKQAMDQPNTDTVRVIEALDDWFGDIEDPELVELLTEQYGDEDDAS